MPKIYEVYGEAIKKGKEHGVLSNDLRILIAHDMGYELPIDTLYHKDEEMTKLDEFNAQFDRLLKNEPVEYIINEAQFLEYKLYVDPNVLIPRMETQELIANITERIMDYYDPRNYLVCADIGTGSGAIAIALKGTFKNWLLTASDISDGALEIARKNIKKYGFSINTLKGKSLEPYIEAKMNLDIIVSNPPYILNKEDVQDSVKDYEPKEALYLEEENNVYEDIFKNYKKVKRGSLLMCFEIGYDLKDYLIKLMGQYLEDYEYEFIEDLNGLTRFLFINCK
jgi:release factor glutamine methyltransferase